MRSQRFLQIGALLPALALSSSYALADQFVAVDVTYTHSADTTKDSHYFVTPAAATPPNWKAPVNYAGGTVHLHFEVFTKPSQEAAVWVVCFIGTPGYACTDSGSYTTAGIYDRSRSMSGIWQYDQVDWTKKINQIPVILKDDNGVKIAPENVGVARSALFMPTKVHMVVTLVSAGGTYVPPADSDAGTIDAGPDGRGVVEHDANSTEDATAPALDRGPGPTSTEDSAPGPVTPGLGATTPEAGNAPSAIATPVSDLEGGCSVGHGRRPAALGAFLAFLMLARWRRRSAPAPVNL